jgi:hypothetical protein
MATTTQRPFFCVVLSDGQQWAVGAEWPDGAIEQIDAFKHLDIQSIGKDGFWNDHCLMEAVSVGGAVTRSKPHVRRQAR